MTYKASPGISDMWLKHDIHPKCNNHPNPQSHDMLQDWLKCTSFWKSCYRHVHCSRQVQAVRNEYVMCTVNWQSHGVYCQHVHQKWEFYVIFVVISCSAGIRTVALSSYSELDQNDTCLYVVLPTLPVLTGYLLIITKQLYCDNHCVVFLPIIMNMTERMQRSMTRHAYQYKEFHRLYARFAIKSISITFCIM